MSETRYTKTNLRDLIAQIYYEEPDKPYSQIKLEHVLAGKEHRDMEVSHFRKIEFTAWLFGFVSRNTYCEDLERMFIYGFKHRWFFHDIDDDDYQDLLTTFMMDILGNRELFVNLADYIVTKYKPSKLGHELIKILYATGYTRLDLDEIVKIKRMYDEKENS